MAKRWACLAVGLFCVMALTSTGCQSTGNTTTSATMTTSATATARANRQPSMLASIPPPSFSGPNIVASSAPPPSAVAPQAAAPAPSVITGPRAWVPQVPPRPWKWIVIHHSATPTGNMALFDKEHKAKGWDGVGYHFVIGNGTNSGDGQIEVTPRWPIQKWGAHAKTLDNRYNEYGIGICLVGNFDTEHPTAKQMQSVTRLVSYLMRTYHISPENVLGHRDTKQTDCPGRFVNVATIRQMASQAIADAGGAGGAGDAAIAGTADPADRADARPASGTELLGDISTP